MQSLERASCGLTHAGGKGVQSCNWVVMSVQPSTVSSARNKHILIGAHHLTVYAYACEGCSSLFLICTEARSLLSRCEKAIVSRAASPKKAKN